MKNILITGASSAIGKALLDFWGTVEENSILITSKSKNLDISSYKAKIRYLANIDLTEKEDLSELAANADSFFNDSFSFVHSVGDFWYHVPFLETDINEASRYMSSHYLSLYGAIYSLIPLMIDRGGGRILAFSCNSVGYNYPHMAPFTCAKAAIECLIKCVSNEFNGENISANALSLASIYTRQVVESKPYGDRDSFIRLEELVRCVDSILFDSSSLMNGNIIKVIKHSDSFYNKGYFERNKR